MSNRMRSSYQLKKTKQIWLINARIKALSLVEFCIDYAHIEGVPFRCKNVCVLKTYFLGNFNCLPIDSARLKWCDAIRGSPMCTLNHPQCMCPSTAVSIISIRSKRVQPPRRLSPKPSLFVTSFTQLLWMACRLRKPGWIFNTELFHGGQNICLVLYLSRPETRNDLQAAPCASVAWGMQNSLLCGHARGVVIW